MNRYVLVNVYSWLVILLVVTNTFAQNPISPPGVYLADPSARCWNDSTLFLYTSTDMSCDNWCSWKYDILFTKDLINWKLVSNVFSSKGENDMVHYNDHLLFAPDGAKIGDSYYLYYCQPDKNNALGTAISNNPTGPFTNAQILSTGPAHSQIDPSVFIDDDSTAYIVWGQQNMKMAILKPNMRIIDSTTIKSGILTVNEHFFHEGAFMMKRNGIYYLIYADESRKKMPTCLGYATSDKPFGPYKYQGVIIDNSGCNPGNWNNHGSVIEFNNQWYVLYHRSTHGCSILRKACIEKIRFLPNGNIPEVEMTSQGVLPYIEATSKIEAEMACSMQGNVRIEKESDNNEKLSQMRSGDIASYKYLNFGDGLGFVTLRYKVQTVGKLVLYVQNNQQLNRIGELEIKSQTQSKWEEQTFEMEPVKGVAELVIYAEGGSGDLFEIDWFKFSN